MLFVYKDKPDKGTTSSQQTELTSEQLEARKLRQAIIATRGRIEPVLDQKEPLNEDIPMEELRQLVRDVCRSGDLVALHLFANQLQALPTAKMLDVIDTCRAMEPGTLAPRLLRIIPSYNVPLVQNALWLTMHAGEASRKGGDSLLGKRQQAPERQALGPAFDLLDMTENEALHEQVTTKEPHDHQAFLRISDDYIARYDKNAKPEAMAKYEAEGHVNLPLSALIERLQDESLDNKALSQILLQVHYNYMHTGKEQPADYSEWHEMCPTLSEDQWAGVFDLMDAIKAQKPPQFFDRFVIDFKKNFSDEQRKGIRRELTTALEKLRAKQSDERRSVHFDSYEDVAKNPLLNPFPSANDEYMHEYLQRLHHPDMRKLIERDLGLKLNEFSLASQIHLLRFMSDKTKTTYERFKKVLEKHPEARQTITNTFLACAQNKEYGNMILDLLEKHPEQAKRITEQFKEITDVFQEQEEALKQEMKVNESLKGQVDIAKLYRTVTKRGIALLGDYSAQADRVEDTEVYLEKAKAYNREVVTLGALFSAASELDGDVVPPEVINKLVENIRVEMVQGGDLIQSDSPEAMLDPANYIHPELFSVENYKMIVRNLERAYSEIDPNWLKLLIKGIAKDLQNEKVTFLMVKNKQGELVGVTKRKDMSDKHFYVGTLYVDEEYQRGFGIGQYLSRYIRQTMPEGSTVEATVAAANSAASRHIDILGAVGDRITYEGEGEERSNELIRTIKPQHKFLTKNKEEYSEGRLRGMVGEEKGNIHVIFTDTSKDNVGPYTTELSKWFEQGYFLTRFFYDGGDQKKSYLVLERPETEMSENRLAA